MCNILVNMIGPVVVKNLEVGRVAEMSGSTRRDHVVPMQPLMLDERQHRPVRLLQVVDVF